MLFDFINRWHEKNNHQGRRLAALITLTYVMTQICFLNSVANGVTQYTPNDIGFVRDLKELKPSLKIPTKSTVVDVEIPIDKLIFRARRAAKDERVEPVQIYVTRNYEKIQELATKIARPGYTKKVEQILIKKLEKLGPTNRSRARIDLELSELKYMRAEAISKNMAREHHSVTILTRELNKNRELRSEFLDQVKLFLEKKQRRIVTSRLRKNRNLSLEKHLLPHFARKMIRQFLVYRGPNCFHAALAFHDPDLTRSPAVNVKEEPGYHRAMINYDELWRAISRNFYEVDPRKSPLKYGDMLVFFAVDKQQEHQPINFKWIRHTATYLFDNYTFSKGSKSPNTPYTIKTLGNEWQTWQTYTKGLGVKVFRRIASPLSKIPPVDLIDWIY